VFSITVGNILPYETITVNLSYISPLIDDESPKRTLPNGTVIQAPQLRFTLPRAYTQRYGTVPTDKIATGVTHEDVPFTMNVSIQQAGRIRSVTASSGYNTTVNLGTRPSNINASAGPDDNFATVKIRRGTNLTTPSSDIVLVITADNLEKPRAFIEFHPDRESAAISLNIVPSRLIEPGLSMEFIFLVDRSNSMAGDKLQMTQAALKLCLKSLPARNSSFNIFSFGTNVDSLGPQSRPYNDISVDQANAYIESAP
jgi:hypothetical protein